MCVAQNIEDCRPIIKQTKISADFKLCKDGDPSCYSADEQGQFVDFRFLEGVQWFNFELIYRGNTGNEKRIVKWTQEENPLTIKDQKATIYEPETWTRNGELITNADFIHRSQMKFGGLSLSSTAGLVMDAQPGTGYYLQAGTVYGAFYGIYQASNDAINEIELKICGAPKGKEIISRLILKVINQNIFSKFVFAKT